MESQLDSSMEVNCQVSAATLEGQRIVQKYPEHLDNFSPWSESTNSPEDASELLDSVVFQENDRNEAKAPENEGENAPQGGDLSLSAYPNSAESWSEYRRTESQFPQSSETKQSSFHWVHWPSQNEQKPVNVGAGLENLGNTCFLNSVLQCFLHTVPLLQCLLLDAQRTPCYCGGEGFCLLCALHELVELCLTSTGRVVSPWKLVDNLSYLSSSFQRFQQEDAHEFLQSFLDKLESFCNGSKRKGMVLTQRVNLVKQVFGGRLVSKLRCCNCSHSSDTYEPLIDLSLEIGDADSLVTALQSFTNVERIEDPETKFTCENCKEQVSIEKQLLLDEVPSVAAFHLKRFKTDGYVVEKIDKHVAFPLELNLGPYIGCGERNAGFKYELYAVVVHVGLTPSSGHYYCFIRVSPGVWYKFDDSKVVRVHEHYVLSQEAYILFYAKQGTSWFSDFIEIQKLWVNPAILNTSPKSVLDDVDVSPSRTMMQKNYVGEAEACNNSSGEALMEDNSGARQTEPVSGSIIGNNETKDCELRHNGLESSKVSDDLDMVSSLVSVPDDVSVMPSCETYQVTSQAYEEKNDLNQLVDRVGTDPVITPRTPPRSPSPEIYKEDPPDDAFCIPLRHLRSAEHPSCKRQLNKEQDDLETKQARSFIRKTIPGSRGQQLLAALKGSHSEGSLNRKRRKVDLTPGNDNRNSNARQRSNIGYGLHPLVAEPLR